MEAEKVANGVLHVLSAEAEAYSSEESGGRKPSQGGEVTVNHTAASKDSPRRKTESAQCHPCKG